MDATLVTVWRALCQELAPAFSAPTWITFLHVATGWVLCRSKPTVTNLVCTISDRLLGHVAKHWTVYERFFYRAAWSLPAVSQLLLRRVVMPLVDAQGGGTNAPVELIFDGTTCGRSGRHVAYADYFKPIFPIWSSPSYTAEPFEQQHNVPPPRIQTAWA